MSVPTDQREYRQVRQSNLSQTAQETISVLPSVLERLPNIDTEESALHLLNGLPSLEAGNCPGHKGCEVRVIDDDTLDAAIALAKLDSARVVVLNLASDTHAGGGWLNGALAQEESICYRSSLYLSLHASYYPLPPLGAIYTPSMVVMRTSWTKGHAIMHNTKPEDLPVMSVISLAALRRPRTRSIRDPADRSIILRYGFENHADRNLTKSKMRLCLRLAGMNGHTRLVLGALGCGAFRNPTEEVAICWREVLQEPEFSGGWWEEIVFAVLDKGSDGDNGARDNNGNFAVFERVLNGLVV
ncbi:mitochondrial chaperone BCS1 [Venturia nashicola]|uniref:Mitochondrial chaperone BCS1 n=1 Tax=Venturia nashicola TaxID=86259 RepID=A0A4Z1P7A5_9PEZI|nr:mitochondrial chaperone BCS1 [Venturia nashicola]